MHNEVISRIENILTHPSSEVWAVDKFPDWMLKRFRHSMSVLDFKGELKILRGASRIKLRNLPFNYFDIIYLDGGHTMSVVLSDTVMVWDSLKEDGILCQFVDFR